MNFKLKNPKSEKESLILFYSTLSNNERFVYSMGEKLPTSLWDFNVQRPKKTKSQKDQELINMVSMQLNRYSLLYNKTKSSLINSGSNLTKKKLKEVFDQEFKNIKIERGFWGIYKEFCDSKKSLGQWSKSTQNRYESCFYNLLKDFESSGSKLNLDTIDDKWEGRFKTYCENIKRHQINTYGRNLGLLKAFLGYSYNEGYTKNEHFRKIKIKRVVTDQVALTKEELESIYNLDLSASKKLERVRDVFILGCNTGLRFSDYKRISRGHVSNGYITVRETKDKSKTQRIPLSKTAQEILEKYDYKLPKISDQKFRDYIKDVADLAGINEPVIKVVQIGNQTKEEPTTRNKRVSTHTARRTFITIMKNMKVPDTIIMKITGHKSMSSFNMYYKPTSEDVELELRRVFD